LLNKQLQKNEFEKTQKEKLQSGFFNKRHGSRGEKLSEHFVMIIRRNKPKE